ncbi:hypothetical protein FSP39_023495 [Pinctada imbricata]|uniref:AMP-dependent synthetase/ligase domain-containing protein n=1 Tax=Pinctada imbricata TaxID=66713 RepID=A0AA88YG14_PINIB|nr:hypothetical protein FSP39_023495 [Pinctada imbricata]
MQTDLSYTVGQGSIDVPYITIPDLVRKHAENPNAVAQISIDWQTNEGESLTFKELYESASKFAIGLKNLGVQKGDIVAIGTDNCKECTIVTVGSMMSGAACLFFYFDRNDGKDLKALLQKVGNNCKAIVFPEGKNNAYLDIMDKILVKHNAKGKVSCDAVAALEIAIVMSQKKHPEFFSLQDVMKMATSGFVLPQLAPEDMAGIFLTSGTTGLPKLVPHSHYALVLFGFQLSIGYGSSSTFLFNDRPFNWMVGSPLWEISTGKTRVYIKQVASIPTVNEYESTVRKVLKTFPCDAYILTPAVLHDISRDEDGKWNLKNVATAGQPILSSLMKSVSRICQRFTNMYGSTEVLILTYQVCEKGVDYPDFLVGKPISGVEIKVVDENGSMLKRGERGEAYVRSPSTFKGYLNDDKSTAGALTEDGWYRMGDSAIMLEDDSIIIEGRRSECLMRSGARFITMSVAQIEAALKQHALIKDAVAVPLLLEEQYPTICCAIILHQQGAFVDNDQLKEFLLDPNGHTGSLFREIDVPTNFIVFQKEFPKTFNGKVKRKEIAELCKKYLAGDVYEV